MNWGSFASFIDMGGYGTYVWGSYILSAVVLAAEVVLVRQRRRTLLRMQMQGETV